jgi:hypothetical protein
VTLVHGHRRSTVSMWPHSPAVRLCANGAVMKNKLCSAVLLVGLLVGTAKADEWGPWRATSAVSVDYRERWSDSACGKSSEFYFRHIRNRRSTRVRLEVVIRYYSDGIRQEFKGYEDLAPGAESETNGAWLCAQRRAQAYGESMTVSVTELR